VLSVVLVAAASDSLLDDCLRSVLDSSHGFVEVLVVGAAAQGDHRVRSLPEASTAEAVRQATGRYLTFVDATEVVDQHAWRAMVDTLEETGSDVVLADARTAEPRPWAAELYASRRLRQTPASFPLALVDLSPSHKVFRLDRWRAEGTSPTPSSVLAAYLRASSYDVLPRTAGEVRDVEADRPVAERSRFSSSRVAERLAALVEASRQAPPGWRELAASYLLPPLYVDAVGGGERYLDALREGARPLLEGLDPDAVPVAARLGAWSVLRGSWRDVALVQDLLADNPDGLPASEGVVAAPAGLSSDVPDDWRRITPADRRTRTWVQPSLAVEDDRVVVSGATFVEHESEAPLPEVNLVGPGTQPVTLDVRPRRDPRVNEWAARAWEDRSDAGWRATGDAAAVLARPGRRWTVVVRVDGHAHEARVRLPQQPGRNVMRATGFADGVLTVEGGDAAAIDLHDDAFGERVRRRTGRHQVTGRAAWAPDQLRDQPELVDDRQRVTLVQEEGAAAVQVHAPLRQAERGAFAQQRLRSSVYAAPAEVERTTVLLETFRGRSVGDSPGAIGRELLSRNGDLEVPLDFAWVVDDCSVKVPEGTRAVPRRSAEWHRLLGHAHGYIANAGAPYWFTKASGQFHLQTWHGTPLKRIGEDRGPGDFSTWRHRRRIAAQAAGWDAMVSPSPFCSRVFRSAFGFEGPMLEIGYPRNDVLVNDRGARRAQVRRRLGLSDADRVVLYAPTWREYLGVRTSKPVYVDAQRLVSALPDAVLLVRGHYNSTGQRDLFEGEKRIHDVTRYPDVADLFLAADALVTDYSSVMFDFVLTDRPVVLLVPDLEQYRDVERGFYFDIESRSPGPLVDTTDEVVDVLGGADQHAPARAAFREEFCPYDDGLASVRAVDDLLARW
jgi:CDP-glycerol glycerophosphotransferase (TagB/SpsB family)